MRIYACPECGSKTLIKKYLVEGPITYVHESYEIYICQMCGWEGTPICFRTEKQYLKFLAELQRREGSGDS
ncbi:MAG: hypothetical protein N3F63_07450 [Thermoplasmata archaeon]|nr:hypothetical protein [Thermoplasmata archaeon]